MKPEDIQTSRDAAFAVRWLIEQREEMLGLLAALEARIDEVESKQGFFAQRDFFAPPRFPVILRRYGITPPSERNDS